MFLPQAAVTVSASIILNNGTPWNTNTDYDGIAIRNTAVQLIPALRPNLAYVTPVAPNGDAVVYAFHLCLRLAVVAVKCAGFCVGVSSSFMFPLHTYRAPC